MINFKSAFDYRSKSVSDYEDDGTMPQSLANIHNHLIGKSVTDATVNLKGGITLALTGGVIVTISGEYDCCAFTELNNIVFNLKDGNNVITNVTSDDGYNNLFILSENIPIVSGEIQWSCGNPFYYSYGFTVKVDLNND